MDKKIFNLINKEYKRQKETIQLIPSENFSSPQVRKATGSVLAHKYSEGQIGNRYYEGSQFIDQIETICKKRALKLFELDKSWHVNVQAYSGSIANLAVLNSVLKPGDTILSLKLTHGGHLSHGWEYKQNKTTHTSQVYNIEHYFVDEKTSRFNYDSISRIAKNIKPQLIISGGTAVPQEIDYKKMAEVARKSSAFYLADVAHEAGLIAAKVNKSPFKWADFVTMTTHKTLRGPKGALIFTRNEFAKSVDRAVFPGLQGGPANANIAAVAIALKEAQTEEFRIYADQIIRNAKVLAETLIKYNFDLVSGGTEKHLLLLNLSNKNIDGQSAAFALAQAGIIVNKNTIPYEPKSPLNPSGIRVGTPFETTRGLKEQHMKQIGKWIYEVVTETSKLKFTSLDELRQKINDLNKVKKIRKQVKELCSKFKLPF